VHFEACRPATLSPWRLGFQDLRVVVSMGLRNGGSQEHFTQLLGKKNIRFLCWEGTYAGLVEQPVVEAEDFLTLDILLGHLAGMAQGPKIQIKF
jgi:hypothetical protein